MRAIRTALALGLALLSLPGCTPEDQPNKARQSTTDQILQQQQREQERNRVIQDSIRPTLPSTTTR